MRRKAGREALAQEVEPIESFLGPTLGNDLDYLIRTLRRRQVGIVGAVLEGLNLPISAWYPLVVLNRGDGISQRELAKRLSLKDAAVGRAIDGLERDGLVQRGADAGDRRKFLISLTPKGRKTASKVTALRIDLLEAMQKGFSARERDVFRRLLQRAFANLGDLAARSSVRSTARIEKSKK